MALCPGGKGCMPWMLKNFAEWFMSLRSPLTPNPPSNIMSSEFETPIYVLDDNDLNSEVSRLKIQYLYFKTVFDSNAVPPVVNINQVRKVIDVATGTGAWALDFVSQPNVRDRDVQVFACDISSAKFPQAGKPDVDKIRFFEHDVTKPFPDEMLGTFDLVNMSCMCFALTVQGWKSALQNLHDLLKPGGHLTPRDIDTMVFTHENPLPLEGQEPDIVAYTQGKSTLATINRISLVGRSDKASSSSECTSPRSAPWLIRHSISYHFREMLQDASLQVLSSTRALAPHGEYCSSHKGLNGTSLSEFTAYSFQSFSRVLNVVTSAMMKAGCLELGDGTRIADEEERKALMRELRHFVERGILLPLSEWVVVRPLGS
ncbi:S-adenosyl-L-methionine-dependent methyltransferase [Lactarius sanguifluus]|nr:S-adenosyl-L-methionine-dependent methyltransferase [Lactarius sanguifluus]